MIYGNDENAVSQVNRVLETLTGDIPFMIIDQGSGASVRDFVGTPAFDGPNPVRMAVFIGSCPEEDLAVAINQGIRCLLILAECTISAHPLVTVSEAKGRSDTETINADIKRTLDAVYNDTDNDLKVG